MLEGMPVFLTLFSALLACLAVGWLVARRRAQSGPSGQTHGQTHGLGMPFGQFLAERAEAHLKAWCLAGFMAGWGGLFWQMRSGQAALDGWLALLLGFVVMVALALLLAFVVMSLLVLIGLVSNTLAASLLFVALPLLPLSIWLEARWRVRYGRPYVPPRVMPVLGGHDAAPASCGLSGLLLAFALGWWLSGSNSDGET